MEEQIQQQKLALDIAQKHFPEGVRLIEQMIGTAYLHFSEMENGTYHSSENQGIWPPPVSGEHYAKQAESRLAIQYLRACY